MEKKGSEKTLVYYGRECITQPTGITGFNRVSLVIVVESSPPRW